MKILLVDDHEGWLARVRDLFEQAGHEVTTCTNVEAALQAYRLERPDLIITDYEMWQMPGGNGDRLISAVRALENGDGRRTPIHMLSGAFDAQRKWREFGADGFTDKSPILFSGRPIETLLEILKLYQQPLSEHRD
jgi:CheY-like chemotaxis protein